jgi:serine phosphatase RsbU (regulator of sigma subunit)
LPGRTRGSTNKQQRQIAHTLQTALLPDDLPVIPGLTMAARFVPNGDGIEVGGGLYDVFPSPDGWATESSSPSPT